MKRIFLLILIAGSFAACKKNPATPQPTMDYTDYHDSVIRYNQEFKVDLNKDGTMDFFFTVSLIADSNGDHQQYHLVSHGTNKLLINSNEQLKAHAANVVIGKDGGLGYTWLRSPSGIIVEKVITPTVDYWQGTWKDKLHNYIGVCIEVNNQKYYGWINVSHLNNKVIVHDAALCNVANTDVVAGK